MSSDIKLLPCPFCGGEARLTNGIPKINYIKCKRCQTMTSNSEVIERVIELWNTRKPMDRIVERLQYAKEMPITDMGKSYNRALDFAISEIKAGDKL